MVVRVKQGKYEESDTEQVNLGLFSYIFCGPRLLLAMCNHQNAWAGHCSESTVYINVIFTAACPFCR